MTQRYAPDTVDIYRYMPFALPDTVTDTINLFAVLLSPDFTCRGKNNLTSDFIYMLPFYTLIQWRFNLFTAHHAVCAVRLRFSNRHGYYFSYLTGSSPIWDFIRLVLIPCIICFSISRYTSYWSVAQYLKCIAILSTLGSISRSLAFGVPSYFFVVYSLPNRHN